MLRVRFHGVDVVKALLALSLYGLDLLLFVLLLDLLVLLVGVSSLLFSVVLFLLKLSLNGVEELPLGYLLLFDLPLAFSLG